MRSSKSRSRSKSNRNRSVGNIVNRVFDSSGPEGKVRGTPQQIIDKYNQLARDAQLGNDRVAFENFQQHAEHYTRMLSEAQREQEARREQQEQHNRERQQGRDDEGDDGNERGREEARQLNGHDNNGGGGRPSGDRREQPPSEAADTGDVIDMGEEADSNLVETPESKPSRPRRRRRAPSSDDEPGENGADPGGKTEAAD